MGISCWCGGGKPRTTSAHELLTRILCSECLHLCLLCLLLRYLPRRSCISGWAWWTSVHPLHPLLLHLLQTLHLRPWSQRIRLLLQRLLLHPTKLPHLLHWLKTLVPLLHLLRLLESTTQPAYASTPSAECHMLTRLYAEDAKRHIA